MIAALGMYDRPELRPDTDGLWGLIRDRLRAEGIAAPETLTRDERAYLPGWLSPELLLAQTCGLPLRSVLRDRVTLVGTPDYGLEGCPPGHYRSMLIARRDDPRADEAAFAPARFAVNDALSQSGWAAALHHMEGLGLTLPPALETGGHVASARAVAEGRADWAALDAMTWRLICAHDPALAAALRVFGATRPTPGLPLITAQGRDPAPLRRAVSAAINTLAPEARTRLGLRGLMVIPLASYHALPIPPPPVLRID